jgi:hypothetical protein
MGGVEKQRLSFDGSMSLIRPEPARATLRKPPADQANCIRHFHQVIRATKIVGTSRTLEGPPLGELSADAEKLRLVEERQAVGETGNKSDPRSDTRHRLHGSGKATVAHRPAHNGSGPPKPPSTTGTNMQNLRPE